MSRGEAAPESVVNSAEEGRTGNDLDGYTGTGRASLIAAFKESMVSGAGGLHARNSPSSDLQSSSLANDR